MSVAYRVFPEFGKASVMVVNSFCLNMAEARQSFLVTEEVANDKEKLEKAVTNFVVEVMKMNPNAVHLWECKDLGDAR